MFFPRRGHYFSHELNREVVELYWQTVLYNLAINLAYIFEPIFLYNLGYSLTQILFFYIIVYTAYALLVVPLTKITVRIGYKHAIAWSSVFYVVYWIVLYLIKSHPALFFVAPLLFTLQKCFFWPPYNADIAVHNIESQRGREVGVLFSLVEMASIVGPIIGGLLAFMFGFQILFFVSALVMISSVYPLFLSPDVYPKHEFHFKNFINVLRRYPKNFFAYWGYAEDLMLMSLWPIYIFLIVPQVFSVGAIITFASLIAIVLMLYLGKLLDHEKSRNLLPIGAVFYGMTWIFRFLATNPLTVVAFDGATRLGKALVNVPLLKNTFAIAVQSDNHPTIAYTVFYEFSLALGKIFTALIAIWILNAGGGIGLVFLVVGVLTMFYAFLSK